MTNADFPSAIAIDGPAASGKTTVGRMLADSLRFLFLDTGVMYRATTLAGASTGRWTSTRSRKWPNWWHLWHWKYRPPAGEEDGRCYTVLVNGQDVTWDLRLPPGRSERVPNFRLSKRPQEPGSTAAGNRP